jgi:hypothetical protein
MKKEGLIIELPHPFHKEGRRFASNLTPHDHLICNYCGSVTDIDTGLDLSVIDQKIYNDYEIKSMSLNVYGICSECKAKKESELKEELPGYRIKPSVKDGILEIVVTGDLTNFSFDSLVKEVVAIEKTVNVTNEMIDVRKLKGRLGYAEVFNLVKKYPSYKLKMNIALVDIPANAQIGAFHTEMASNAGFNYKWFKSVRAAKDWLKSQSNS